MPTLPSLLRATLALVLIGAGAVSAQPAPQKAIRCRCTPTEPCWPSQADLADLSARLTYPVFTPHPPAFPCHDPYFDAAGCASAMANYYDTQWRSDQPGASEADNWQFTSDLRQVCYLNASRTDACAQGRVPVLGINATTAADIQEGVRFASARNIKVVVKNTGHDGLGASLGENGLLIWTHNMKSLNYSDNFVPDQGTPSGFPAVTFGAGVQWKEGYDFTNAQNKSIAGGIGADGSVGAAGGWPLGGGHNIISPLLGLGVDNVLQITAVLPNGSYVIANSFQNPDLFWALRGGGGLSFGIATSVTYRVHPITPLYAYFYEAILTGNDTFTDVMTSWHTQLTGLADAGWSGYYTFTPNLFALQYLLPNGTAAQSNATLGPWLTQVDALPGVTVTASASVEYPGGFYEWFQDNIIAPAHVIGFNYTGAVQAGFNFAPASWLIPRSIFENATALPPLTDAFAGFAAGIGQQVGGGVVAQVDPDATAVNPAWRTALVDIVISAVWPDGTSAVDAAGFQRDISFQMDAVRALAPVPLGGQYHNEPDLLVPNFQSANWGAHYDRLTQIKQEIDPNALFIVRQGVGSEYWDSEQNCRL